MKIVEIVKANPKAVVATLVVVGGTIGATIVVRKIRKSIKAKKALKEAEEMEETQEDETEE